MRTRIIVLARTLLLLVRNAVTVENLYLLLGFFVISSLRVMTIMGAVPNCIRVLDDVLNGLASVSGY